MWSFLVLIATVLVVSDTISIYNKLDDQQQPDENAARSFVINRDQNRFELDGEPFQYVAGEIHYFRIPVEYWEDRLSRMRAMGLNVAQIYVAWNWHEEREGEFNFKADRDVAAFIKLAAKHDLLVNLRLGPYICAEWEHGGLPWWLLAYPDIDLRSSKGPFLNFTKRFFGRLIDEIKHLQYPDGPIILAQVDNEFGSYACDHNYMNALVPMVREAGLNQSLLYTTDGPGGMKCGQAEGAFPTVDFGVQGSAQAVRNNFKKQHEISGGGPSVNSEFYTGWFDSWGYPRTGLPSSEQVVRTLGDILAQNASVSLYMAHGGTNFGFWNGAELDTFLITSYDYGSPIDEAGQTTDQYRAIRRFIKQLPNWRNKPLAVPKRHATFKFSNLNARRLRGSLPRLLLLAEQNCRRVDQPENFERFNQSFGYAVYSTQLPDNAKYLKINFLRDLAYVFVDGEYQGVLGDCTVNVCRKTELKFVDRASGRLDIVVENLGRLNFARGNTWDYKGIRSEVKVDGRVVKRWRQCGVDVERLPTIIAKRVETIGDDAYESTDAPADLGIYINEMTISHRQVEDNAIHTFFDAANWGKGQLYVNNFNVGRYWASAGPQQTLYVPGVRFDLTGATKNRFVLINFEARPPLNTFSLVDKHIWTSKASKVTSVDSRIDQPAKKSRSLLAEL